MPRTRFPLAINVLLLLALVAAVLWVSHAWWLTALAAPLIHEDGPCRADAGMVLAGDYEGNRIKRMAQMIREGYVPYAFITGGETYYGVLESDMVQAFVRKQGYPENWFRPVPIVTYSTSEEVARLAPLVRQKGIRKLLVVTSNYHTARTRRTIVRELPSLQFCMVASPDPDFSGGGWWKSREGRKLFVLEWLKTIAEFLGV